MASTAAGLIVAAFFAAPGPAEAQIASRRDANGTLVLSERRFDHSVRRSDSSATPGIGAPNAAAATERRRGSEYDRFIDEQAAAHGIRRELIRGVIQQESNFNPRARSPKGAMGLMQLMPGTAAELGVSNAYNPSENIRGGTKYLRRLLDRYDNNERLALAAYNAGPGAVDRYGARVPPYQETQQYVKRILGSLASPSVAEPAAVVASPRLIYKITEVIDGRPVSRYSTIRPSSGTYEIVKLG